MNYPYELATPEQKAIGSLWWCIHHGVKLEPLTEPIENRVAYIREGKAEHERETRLRAMRPVVGPLPPPLVQAYAALEQAGTAQVRARAAWELAYEAWKQAFAAQVRARAAWELAYAAQKQAYEAAWGQAYAAQKQAYEAREQAFAAQKQAYAAWEQALKDHAAEIDALFAVECADVAWGPDGLVFPAREATSDRLRASPSAGA
jgi:hypothetical protein